MKIQVPFAYEATVTTATRNQVTRSYVERREIVIPDVPEQSAPVVAILQASIEQDGNKTPEPMRLLGGQVFLPMRITRHGETRYLESEHSDHDDIVSNLRDLKCVNLALQTGRDGTPEVKRAGPPRPETVVYDYDREKAVGVIDDLSNDFMSIDGLIYRRQKEPVYHALHGRVTVGPAGIQDNQHLFRLDEFDLAIKRAAVRANISEAEVLLPEFEILDLSWVQADFDKVSTVFVTNFVRDRIGGKILKAPPALMAAFVEARDLSRQYSDSAFDLDETVLRIRDCLDMADRLGVNLFDQNESRLITDLLDVHRERELRRPTFSDIDAIGLAP